MVTALAIDAALAGAPAFVHPRAQVGAHLFVGRQGIFGGDGSVHGYEFLYRAGREHCLQVDQWPAQAQDRATLRVLQATFGGSGVRSVASDALAFVNVTRSFIVGDLPLPPEPDRLVIEVVESVRTDREVLAGLARLRTAGYRIAIDDFVGLTHQVAMLPYADYVKVDRRDIYERGGELVDLARSTGATLVAERIETRGQLESCLGLGFDLLQGFYLETTHVLNRTPVPSSRPDRPTLRVLDALRPRLPEPAVAL